MDNNILQSIYANANSAYLYYVTPSKNCIRKSFVFVLLKLLILSQIENFLSILKYLVF